MPTQKPRVTFTISKEQLELVENFQFSNKIKNQTQAILQLIERGLEDFSPEIVSETKNSPSIEDGDIDLLEKYHTLDIEDRAFIRGEIAALLRQDKYSVQDASKNA